MTEFDPQELQKLYKPASDSHKGQNGKLLLIGGSELFHAASLWSLQVASRIVDMVFYASVPVNNDIVKEAKTEFRNGIVIPREHIEDYVEEADCILIGPGMVRTENTRGIEFTVKSIAEALEAEHEGMQTYHLTKYLLQKYPGKKWVIDGGALQMTDPKWLKDMPRVIITPHHQEFERVFGLSPAPEHVEQKAQEFGITILRKGEEDVVASKNTVAVIKGGNPGMTKGGTGDVLAGLVGALACKNELFLSAAGGSYINKKAGEELFKRVGTNFNSSDLALEIPVVMHQILG